MGNSIHIKGKVREVFLNYLIIIKIECKRLKNKIKKI